MAGGGASAQDPTFGDDQLDQMLAPIALHPDALLSQMLMASTYPLDVGEAVEWSAAHPDQDGDAAVEAVQDKNWDPSVKSLVAFPQAYGWVTLGTFLVGLGWAAANVAATAYIADHSETAARGRTIGINDTCAGAIAVVMAVLTGPLIAWSGLPAAGVMAMMASLLPALGLPAVLAARRRARAFSG